MMSVSTVKIFRHGKKENWLGVNQEFATNLKAQIMDLINQAPLKFKEVKLFLMDDAKNEYRETTQNTLSIFVQARPTNTEGYVQLKYSGEVVIGYYHPETMELYLLQQFNTLNSNELAERIAFQFSLFMEEAIKPFNERNSWINKKANPALRQRITNYLSSTNNTLIRDLKEKMNNAERRVADYTRNLKEEMDKRNRFARDLLKAEQTEVTGLDEFIKGLDTIAEHPKVNKLDVENEKVIIGISDVHMFARVERQEKRFYLGDMEVHINVANTEVKFYNASGNTRRSYWTEADPHPHVNGGNGNACLGNVGTTIAELCSSMEIYALFLVCLDFLENANTEDPAGRNVVNWDECDEDGNILAPAGTYDEPDEDEDDDTRYCPNCDEHENADDFREVLVEFDTETGAHLRHEDWCDHCSTEEATSHGASGERVDDRIIAQVEAYYEANA